MIVAAGPICLIVFRYSSKANKVTSIDQAIISCQEIMPKYWIPCNVSSPKNNSPQVPAIINSPKRHFRETTLTIY